MPPGHKAALRPRGMVARLTRVGLASLLSVSLFLSLGVSPLPIFTGFQFPLSVSPTWSLGPSTLGIGFQSLLPSWPEVGEGADYVRGWPWKRGTAAL